MADISRSDDEYEDSLFSSISPSTAWTALSISSALASVVALITAVQTGYLTEFDFQKNVANAYFAVGPTSLGVFSVGYAAFGFASLGVVSVGGFSAGVLSAGIVCISPFSVGILCPVSIYAMSYIKSAHTHSQVFPFVKHIENSLLSLESRVVDFINIKGHTRVTEKHKAATQSEKAEEADVEGNFAEFVLRLMMVSLIVLLGLGLFYPQNDVRGMDIAPVASGVLAFSPVLATGLVCVGTTTVGLVGIGMNNMCVFGIGINNMCVYSIAVKDVVPIFSMRTSHKEVRNSAEVHDGLMSPVLGWANSTKKLVENAIGSHHDPEQDQ